MTQEPTDDADALIRPPLELKRVIARVSTVEADAAVSRPRVVELSTLMAVPGRRHDRHPPTSCAWLHAH